MHRSVSLAGRSHALWLSLHFCPLDCLAFTGHLWIIRPWRWPFAKLWISQRRNHAILIVWLNVARQNPTLREKHLCRGRALGGGDKIFRGHFFGTGIETGVRDFIRPKGLRFAGLGG
jgi:hypothetical protein